MDKTEHKRKTSVAVGLLPEPLLAAARAAHSKKASNVIVLDLRKSAAFTDFFLICSGQHARQVKAIVDVVEEALRLTGVKPAHLEGYERANWVLIDCFDFVVQVFTHETRAFYGLERLWGSAEQIAIPDTAGHSTEDASR